MRIGIFAYRQWPFISANTDIAYLVGEHLKARGHEVVFVGFKQDAVQNSVERYKNIPICFLNDSIPAGDTYLRNLFQSKAPDFITYHNIAKELRKIVNTESLELLICMTAPNWDIDIVVTAKLHIPVLLYQLNPYYNSHDIVSRPLKKKFSKILDYVRWIFTTQLLYEEYLRDEEICTFKNKMSVLEFPKLTKTMCEGKVLNNRPRLLYAGSLYQDIRSPQILIDLRNCLSARYDVVFCGECDAEGMMEQLRKVGVICKGYCDKSTLADEVERADILINIGNKVKNQLGSKIVDYISTGKPIFDIVQFEDCPTKRVLEKYPYWFCINADDLKNQKVEVDSVVDCLIGKCAKWEDIQKEYRRFTPEFVVDEIEKHF